ncbi:MAG TPA: ferredoxin-thioredoxin reductase catalytic domain-containing protein [Anaerolineae bacterium]|jgi:ferredoxin-thioredoxin reductase catalytic subunit/rubredoxin|nr:ferredoxin-thioredoxin reductase catalytic domain-containing protein [Anaerolineae bacterium]
MSSQIAQALYERLKREAEAAGYFLNPDRGFVLGLMDGLLTNEERYGYQSCPCRLAEGVRQKDLDIICPCDYRDPDLDEYGACYCALYVSEEIALGEREPGPVPERRGTEPEPAGEEHEQEVAAFTRAGLPVWRCKVCGYLCARPQPPLKCPICKADKDRFERFT